MSLRLLPGLAFAAVALVGAACSKEISKPPAAGDTTTVQPGAGNGPGGGGTGTDGGVTIVDGGTTTDAGECNDLTLNGPIVDLTAVTGDPPPGTGGTIEDGTYDLTDAQQFVGNGAVGPTGTSYKSTITMTGGVMQQYRLTQSSSGTTTVRLTFTAAVSGTNVALSETCPNQTLAQAWSYSVVGTQLELTDTTSKVQFVYTKK